MSAGELEAFPRTLRAGVEDLLSSRAAGHVEILTATPVTGGCIHHTSRLSTSLREDFFLKWAQDAPPDLFAAEADGLGALRESTDLTVPEVIGHADAGENPAWLLLEYLPRGSPAPDYGVRLGTALAELHEPRDAAYGWHRSNYVGSLPQSNTITGDWSSFWWAERLEPQLARARDNGRPPGAAREWAALESRLPSLLGEAEGEGCSLLHGDLWSGNVYPGPDGRPVLVDPAVYRGHREVDLAMTELFGRFPETFIPAYEDHRPLTDGYRDLRRHVYQLYPLLVHVNLLGGSYVDGAKRALQKALRFG